MYFNDLGNVSIKELNLEPAYELESGCGHGVFFASENRTLVVTLRKDAFLECVDDDGCSVTYDGRISDDELSELRKLYGDGIDTEWQEHRRICFEVLKKNYNCVMLLSDRMDEDLYYSLWKTGDGNMMMEVFLEKGSNDNITVYGYQLI